MSNVAVCCAVANSYIPYYKDILKNVLFNDLYSLLLIFCSFERVLSIVWFVFFALNAFF